MNNQGKVLSYDHHTDTFSVDGCKHKMDLTTDNFAILGIKRPEDLVGCIVSWEYETPYIVFAMGVNVVARKE